MPIKKILFFLCCCTFYDKPTFAGVTSCWLSSGALNFGQISSKGATSSTSIGAHCVQSGYKKSLQITMCLYIPEGIIKKNNLNRQLIAWTLPFSYLKYNLFYDPALTNRIDTEADISTVQCTSHAIAPTQTSFTIDLPIYGKIYSSQYQAAAFYQNVSMPIVLQYSFSDDKMPSIKKTLASKYKAENNFFVYGTYENTCNLTSLPDLNFGQMDQVSHLITGSTVLSFSCPTNTSWKVSLDEGINYDGKSRRMRNGNHYIEYSLYQDVQNNKPWDSMSYNQGVGISGTQRVYIYGKVPTQKNILPAGEYTDTITVRITY